MAFEISKSLLLHHPHQWGSYKQLKQTQRISSTVTTHSHLGFKPNHIEELKTANSFRPFGSVCTMPDGNIVERSSLAQHVPDILMSPLFPL